MGGGGWTPNPPPSGYATDDPWRHADHVKQRIVRKQVGFECYGFNKFNIINFTTFNMHRSIENEHCYTGTGLWVMYVGTFH